MNACLSVCLSIGLIKTQWNWNLIRIITQACVGTDDIRHSHTDTFDEYLRSISNVYLDRKKRNALIINWGELLLIGVELAVR